MVKYKSIKYYNQLEAEYNEKKFRDEGWEVTKEYNLKEGQVEWVLVMIKEDSNS